MRRGEEVGNERVGGFAQGAGLVQGGMMCEDSVAVLVIEADNVGEECFGVVVGPGKVAVVGGGGHGGAPECVARMATTEENRWGEVLEAAD